jgi:hypothetical protein
VRFLRLDWVRINIILAPQPGVTVVVRIVGRGGVTGVIVVPDVLPVLGHGNDAAGRQLPDLIVVADHVLGGRCHAELLGPGLPFVGSATVVVVAIARELVHRGTN